MKTVTISVVTGWLLLALTGCGSDTNNTTLPSGQLITTPTAQLALQSNTSCEALREYVVDTITDRYIAGAYPIPICPDCRTVEEDIVLEDAVPTSAPTDASTDSATFDDFTQTNSQEAGVDELDLVETDVNGNFYLVDGTTLVIANGLPPENLREIAAIGLTDTGYAHGLLLDASRQRLVVVMSGSIAAYPELASVSQDYWSPPSVELFFVDVSDPTNPVVDKQLLLEGYQIAARRIDSRVHLVSHFTPVTPAILYTDAELLDLLERYRDAVASNAGELALLEQQLRERIDELLLQIDINELLPQLWQKQAGGEYVSIPNPSCDVNRPDVSVYLALTSITSVDSDGANVNNLIVVNNAWNVYASENNLYLIQPSSGWWWDPWQREQTAIYKFMIGAGAAEYRAMGVVDGSAWSSFQFSEFKDYLRVATTRNEYDPATDVWTQDNHLFVLAGNLAGTLDIVGGVNGFGVDERIFSARFLGDRGFVVTFRQIDPLFAFDLSDPNNPQLVGELEIPGVSTYIHPLDDNHLLTIGFSGDMLGLNPGFQLQIFNVQDLASPEQVHEFTPDFGADGFAWTSAMYDHLAFNYFDAAKVLTIPVQHYAYSLDQHLSGFAAFSVDVEAGFTELGRLDHSDLARDIYCTDPLAATDGSVCEYGLYLEAANPLRSVSALVDDQTYIYTFSNVGIKASNANDFGTALSDLPLDYPYFYWWWPVDAPL
ncbi:MAG: hypothetical protein HKP12_04070 [Gammaproteobacteria bacterium]|nr:hypothetical protein [Gammaproteobacteria bacterium]